MLVVVKGRMGNGFLHPPLLPQTHLGPIALKVIPYRQCPGGQQAFFQELVTDIVTFSLSDDSLQRGIDDPSRQQSVREFWQIFPLHRVLQRNTGGRDTAGIYFSRSREGERSISPHFSSRIYDGWITDFQKF